MGSHIGALDVRRRRFRRQRRWAGAFALLLGVALLVAACGSSGTSNAGSTSKSTLTIDNESGGLWTCSFNPFSSSELGESMGIVYEPLVYENQMNGKQQNWLASSYSWSNNDETLTFTIRQGVKWSDGKPLTAKDVAFTFQLLQKHPELDLNAIWSVLKSVQVQGSNQVVLQFKQQAVPDFFYIAAQTPIVPQHVWSSISNPSKYTDAHPVGSGPYTVSNCSPQEITYSANQHYWQGAPKVKTVLYPAFTDNQPANLYLAQGKAQWGGQFIPNIQSYYINKNKADRHYWFPPLANVDLFLNQTRTPLTNKTFRQGLAFAIDRPQVSKDGEYGYEPAANQTGVVLPTFNSWYDSSLASQYDYHYDPTKAMQLFEQAGYHKASNGKLESAGGQPVNLNIIDVNGNTDWVASVNIIKGELQNLGITLNVENLSSNAYDSDLFTGNFDLAYGSEASGPSPYYELRNTLYSGDTAPIGQSAPSNYERWKDPQTDAALNSYAQTTSVSQQKADLQQIEKIMLEDVPVIPVTEGVAWFQYDTGAFSGWPTKSNPYADPAPYATPDWEVVLLHLKPR